MLGIPGWVGRSVLVLGLTCLLGDAMPAAGSQLPTVLGVTDSRSALQAEFECASSSKPSEIERGTFALRGDGAWQAEYQSPVHQVTVAVPGLTVFLYPEQHRAVRIWSRQLEAPAWMTFSIQALYGARELAVQGFKLEKFETRRDTTATSWRWPQVDNSEESSVLRTFHSGGLISRLEVVRAGILTRQLQMELTDTLRTIRVPARVAFREWDDGRVSEKKVHYSRYQILNDSRRLFDPTIPAGYKVDERRW